GAQDLRIGRAGMVRDNVRRTRVDGVRIVVGDAARPPLLPGFDRVLVDAPCTGTGTIRRNPEVRYRLSPETLSRSAARARAILEGVAPLLGPGGRLVYATCSLEREENEDVLAWLLERDRGLRLVDP